MSLSQALQREKTAQKAEDLIVHLATLFEKEESIGMNKVAKVESALAKSEKMLKQKDEEIKHLIEELEKTRRSLNDLISQKTDTEEDFAFSRESKANKEPTRANMISNTDTDK